MTWSYSGNPGATSLDALRFAIGDTQESGALLSDEEAAYLLATYSTPPAATLPALRLMLMRCTLDTLVTADGITRDVRLRYDALRARILEVERQALLLVPPFLGGVSIAERGVRQQDSDLIQPGFTVLDAFASLGEGG